MSRSLSLTESYLYSFSGKMTLGQTGSRRAKQATNTWNIGVHRSGAFAPGAYFYVYRSAGYFFMPMSCRIFDTHQMLDIVIEEVTARC
jgi:hypothetical protein